MSTISLTPAGFSQAVENPTSYHPLDLMAIEKAIIKGNIDAFENLPTSFDFKTSLPCGELPLHLAVRHGQEKIVDKFLNLIDLSDLEQKDYQGLTAIDHAELMQNQAIFELIILRKLNIKWSEIQKGIKLPSTNRDVNIIVNHVQNLAKTASTPTQKAIFENDLNELKRLIEADPAVLIPSLLHDAVAARSPEIVHFLLDQELSPNGTDSFGLTPLHYAVALEDFDLMKRLIEKGADPEKREPHGISPLEILIIRAHQRDPLAITNSQLLLCFTSVYFWAAQFAYQSDWINLDNLIGQVFLTMSLAEMCMLINKDDRHWKQLLITVLGLSAGFGVLQNVPFVGFCYRTWLTYNIANSVFKGFKACWNNLGYRNREVGKNFLVNAINGAHASVTYGKTIYKLGYTSLFYKYISDYDRIMSDMFNPNDPKDAAKILSDNFDWSQFSRGYVSKLFRKQSVVFHPDGTKPDCEAFRRLTIAYETLTK